MLTHSALLHQGYDNDISIKCQLLRLGHKNQIEKNAPCMGKSHQDWKSNKSVFIREKETVAAMEIGIQEVSNPLTSLGRAAPHSKS